MYSLDCSYFKHEFERVPELIKYIIDSGMDPNYEITYNGLGTGEWATDYVQDANYTQKFSIK